MKAWLAGLLLLACVTVAHADPYLIVVSNSRTHGKHWETHIEPDGRVEQYVDAQTVPVFSMKLKSADVDKLRQTVKQQDLLHLVWPPAQEPGAGVISLLVNDHGQKNYVEWSGQKVDGPATPARIRFTKVWVLVLKLIPSPNEWETPEFFGSWLH